METLAAALRELCDPWPDACLLVTREGVVVSVNQAAVRLLGRPRRELKGRPLTELVREPGEKVRDYLTACLHNRQQMPGNLSFTGQEEGCRCLGYRVRTDGGHGEGLVFLRCLRGQSSISQFSALNQELERQRQAQRQLKSERDLLETIARNVGAGLCIISRDYRVLWENEVMRQAWGGTVGKNCFRRCASFDSICPWCGAKEIFATGKRQVTSEARCHDRDGNLIYLEVLATALYDEQGRVNSVLELVLPITERKLKERRLKDDERRAEALYRLSQLPWATSEELLALAVEEAAGLTDSEIAFIHLMADGVTGPEGLTFWSKAALANCGTLPQPFPEITGVWAEVARQGKPMRHNDYRQVTAARPLPDWHCPLNRYLGVPLLEEGRVVAIAGVGNKADPYDDGDERQLTLFLGRTLDILRQKRMEREVLTAKRHWELTFDAIDEMVTIHDPQMRIIQANRAAGTAIGVAPEALTGKYCYQVFAGREDNCPGCPKLLAQRDLTPHSATVRNQSLGKDFEVSVFPIVEQGKMVGFVHTARDVTHKLKLEAQLRQAQKMEAIGVLAGGIAHDFNNILMPILGYAEMAQERLPQDDPLFNELTEIVQAANRAKDLVKQILTFTRQNAQERERWPLEPHLVIKEALKLLRASLPATIDIQQSIDPGCGSILADPTQIHQIVMNLCVNAYHAMRHKTDGVLGVRLERIAIAAGDSLAVLGELTPDNYVRLAISDTGHGMDQATMERIFEPYFTTKPQGEGTGMGLSMVMGIVKGYGGHISVYSEPGAGTVFHVYLPGTNEEKTAAEANGGVAPSTLPVGGREQVLVVDDEQGITTMMEMMLRELGYQAQVFNQGSAALAWLRQNPQAVDLLISDLTMPGLTGIELAQEALNLHPGLPVIMISGFSDLNTRETARAAGIDKFLMKPVAIRDLAEALRELLASVARGRRA
ncbi:MAG: PAS domain-containing protein [Desulfobacteraceae bacterium]|nr:PAS domain-containing protein [Desulfobacteraceae bacterium]